MTENSLTMTVKEFFDRDYESKIDNGLLIVTDPAMDDEAIIGVTVNDAGDEYLIWYAGESYADASPMDELHGRWVETVLSPLQAIAAERQRQDAKWGQQNHDPGKWMLILNEELGEIAKSVLENDRENYLAELTQAAAVMVAWIECERRRITSIDKVKEGA